MSRVGIQGAPATQAASQSPPESCWSTMLLILIIVGVGFLYALLFLVIWDNYSYEGIARSLEAYEAIGGVVVCVLKLMPERGKVYVYILFEGASLLLFCLLLGARLKQIVAKCIACQQLYRDFLRS